MRRRSSADDCMLSFVGVPFFSTIEASSSLRKSCIWLLSSPISTMSSKRTTFFLPWLPVFQGRFAFCSSVTGLTIMERIGMNSAMFDDTDEELFRCSARESDVYPMGKVPFSVTEPCRAPFWPVIKGVIVRGCWDPPFPADPLPPLLLDSSYKRLCCKYFLSIFERNGLFKSFRFWAIILDGESTAAGGPEGELILGNDW